MKTNLAITIVLTAFITAAISVRAQNAAAPPQDQQVTNSATPTIVFDQFTRRIQNCKGPFAELEKWFKLIKPELQNLGYTSKQIADLKNKLSSGTPALADARLFSEKWLARHGERLDPNDILHRFTTSLPTSE